MLRMVFEREDLQRVRIAAGPDPMWETVLSSLRARDPGPADRFTGWRRQTRQRAAGSAPADRWLSRVFSLVPARGKFPDFLTPDPRITDIEAACEAIACTPRAHLRSDLGTVFAGRTPPGWIRDLAGGDRPLLHDVVRSARGVYDLLVAPHWQQIRGSVLDDRAERARRLALHGVGSLLTSLPGVIGWDGHTLDVRYPSARTVHLAGRGLTLVPSHFCQGRPVTMIDPGRPPVLIYPVRHRAEPVVPQLSPGLVALLGRTRAECLGALDTSRSTSDLAGRLGTSIGTASKHAAVLRSAGLVRSVRRGGTVLHNLTSLGADLLAGNAADG